MCFNVSKKLCPMAKIAKKDIVVFKFLSGYNPNGGRSLVKGIYYAPYRDTQYDFNKQVEYTSGVILPRFNEVYEGLHSCRNLASFASNDMFIAVVPKGTKYYFNESEIVSEKLIFLGKLSFKVKFSFSRLEKSKQIKEIQKFIGKKKFDLTFEV